MSNSLVKLDLSSNELTHRSSRILANALMKNESLTDLKLQSYKGMLHNNIGPEGAKDFELVMKKNAVLSFLNIGGNQIKNQGLLSICKGLTDNKQFIHLNLSNNGLTSSICDFLARAIFNSCL